jgi:hypothetical protein
MMKALCIFLSLLIFGPSGSAQSRKIWDGFVTDTHCGTHCQRTTAMTPNLECVRLCVKQGSKYGLWYGNHVYVLEPQPQATKFAAQHVRVTGSLTNNTIQIESIVALPQPKPQGQN